MGADETQVHDRERAAPRVSVVIPALNEARNLEVLLPELAAAAVCDEVVLVDGGSVDTTVATARRVLPEVRVVHQVRRGKGNAVVAGFAAASGDVVVVLDADASADPVAIPRLVQALVEGADLARGTRFARGGGSAQLTRAQAWLQRALSVLFNLLFRARHSDVCHGYLALWADVVPALGLPDHRVMTAEAEQMVWGDGFEIEAVIACRLQAADARIVEVAAFERPRPHGRTHLRTVRDGCRVLRTLLVERHRARTCRAALPAPSAAGTPLADDQGPDLSARSAA